MKNLAIVPARSGSKGLPGKNIKPFGGKPLLAHSVCAAQDSCCFQNIIVSTDSEEYAQIARKYGAEVPFLRNPENSSDYASSWDVVAEVLELYKERGMQFDSVTLLQPTSPLRRSSDIKAAFEMMETKGAEAVVSVCKAAHSPIFYNQIPESGSLASFVKSERGSLRRQDVAGSYYRVNGAIYLVKVPFFSQSHDIYREGCFAMEMDKLSSIDIDDELDFIQAEALYLYRDISHK